MPRHSVLTTRIVPALDWPHGPKCPRYSGLRAPGAVFWLATVSFAALVPVLSWPPISLPLLWPASAFAMVTAGYLGLGPAVFGKRGGRIPWPRRLWLAPVLAGVALSSRLEAWRRPPYQEVVPGLLQGRRLNRKEAAWALGDGVTAVVDLAAETSAPALLRGLPYLNLPLLPGRRPSAAQLRLILAFIARHRSRGKVLVHCADGGARSRDVIAAYRRVPQKYRSDDSV